MQRVEILIEGRLDEKWVKRFGGPDLAYTGSGDMRLTGMLADQAALYGLIVKLRDLGIKSISANLAAGVRNHARGRKPTDPSTKAKDF